MGRRGVPWWRRWKNLAWCCLCLFALMLLALRDALPYVLPFDLSSGTSRRCPPVVEQPDTCTTWRRLTIIHEHCECHRNLNVLHDECAEDMLTGAATYMSHIQQVYGNSTCSPTATLRGPRQHVLSYAAPYLSAETAHLIRLMLQEVKENYKGWVVRVYVRINKMSKKTLCSLMCSHDNLDICDVRDIPEPINYIHEREETGWEWAVLGDPLVSAWETRDLRTAIIPRESFAVTQFINSDQCWHLMRDHKKQSAELGGGTIGVKMSYGLSQLIELRHRLFNHMLMTHPPPDIIENELLSVINQDVMFHDSVSCWSSYGALAFPSRRKPGTWVGMPREMIPESSNPSPSALSNQISNTTQIYHSLYIQKMFSKLGDTENNNQPVRSRTYDNIRKKERKHPKLMSNVPLSEEDINIKHEVEICAVRCRPYKHRDWLYC